MIEISSEEQQKFMMQSKVRRKVKSVVGHENANWWIGAELRSGTWYWTHSKSQMSYVAKIGHSGSLDKSYSHAAMYLSKTQAYWYDDNGNKYYVMALCQITEPGDYSQSKSKYVKQSKYNMIKII